MLRDTHVLTVTVQVSSESALPFIHRKIKLPQAVAVLHDPESSHRSGN